MKYYNNSGKLDKVIHIIQSNMQKMLRSAAVICMSLFLALSTASAANLPDNADETTRETLKAAHAGDVDVQHDHPQHGPLDLVNVQPEHHQILSHEKKKKYLAELNSRCRGLYQVIRQSVQVAKAEH